MTGIEQIGTSEKQRFEEAVRLGQAGKLDMAAEIFVSLAAQLPDNYAFLVQAAHQLELLKRFGKAQEVYFRATQLEPDNYLAHAMLGAMYVELGKYPAAVKVLDRAVELSPDDPDLHYNLAITCQKANEMDKAIVHLEKTLMLGGRAHLAFGKLSGIYEKMNKMEKVQKVLNVALEHFPDDPYLNFNAAVFERRHGNHEAALALLDKCLKTKAALDKKGETVFGVKNLEMAAGFEYGRIYDKLGKAQKAYPAFLDANKRAREGLDLNAPDKDKALNTIARFKALDLDNWDKTTAQPLADAENTPAFLVGFPRSGTTLLHHVLDGHSKLEVTEEEPVLSAVAAHIEKTLGDWPKVLKTLDERVFNSYRDDYMKGFQQLKTKEGNVRFIDKFPMHMTRVPLIKKLLPDAKFILALRHPCDCTLSCFMQDFDLNDGMRNFLNLDDASHFYDQVFSLWQKYVDELQIDYTTVRYEDVVEDLEKEARAVISFLGLEWEDGVLDYRQQALAKKRITTPSYSQVVQPIYKDASGRWKRYEEYMAPYLDRLAPYAEAFGYEL